MASVASTPNLSELAGSKTKDGKNLLPHVQAVDPACDILREEVHRFKRQHTTQDTPTTPAKRLKLSKKASLQFLELQQLQRACCSHSLARKQTTQEAKLSMDRACLDLQNVLYEVRHFEKQIADCEALETKYQKVSVIPESELKATSPDAVHVMDPHLIMLRRLNVELLERKRLVDEEQALEKELLEAEAEHAKELSELESLNKELATALKVSVWEGFFIDFQHRFSSTAANWQQMQATVPLQTRLGITNASARETNDKASLLPEPLFVLYKHAVGFARTYGTATYSKLHFLRYGCGLTKASSTENEIDIEIIGDFQLAATAATNEPVAAALPAEKASSEVAASLDRENSVDDMEVDIGQDSTKVHADRSATYYSRHSLDVVLTILAPGGNGQLAKLTFSYLTNLQIVVVAAKMLAPIAHIPPKLFSAGLFPGDVGHDSPNPANAFLGSESDPFRFDEVKAAGNPFAWAQALCGLEYPSRLGDGRYYLQQLPALLRARIDVLKDLGAKLIAAVPAFAKLKDVDWKLAEVRVHDARYYTRAYGSPLRALQENDPTGLKYEISAREGEEETQVAVVILPPPPATTATLIAKQNSSDDSPPATS
ncbi:THO complex subunit 5 [Geranomyces michiganensis]|nr:THO complex subunit 5 [Geranomyces michiganensis]